MGYRSRRFLLILTLIACALVHAPRLHEMQAKPIASPVAPPAPVKQTDARPLVTKWSLEPWLFDASPLPATEPQELSFTLISEQPASQSPADALAMSRDVALFSDTEFAVEMPISAAIHRTVGRLPRLADNSFVIQPRCVFRSGRGVNYVKPALSSPIGFSWHTANVPLRASNAPVVRRPQTGDGEGPTVVGETPDPSPNPVPTPAAGAPDPTPGPGETGEEGGAGGTLNPPDLGEVGGGLGGLPTPGNEIPEPTFLATILCVAMLLRRPSQRR